MRYICPLCQSSTKHYPLYTDDCGNPTDGSYISYCPDCDWEEDNEDKW
jgi:predicted amidophosphoribosyltransferase